MTVEPLPAQADTVDAPPAGCTVRALHFDGDRCSRAIDVDAVQQHGALPDHQLLWVDLALCDGPPDNLLNLGLDPALLDPSAGGELGLIVAKGWKYLYMRALNWRGAGRSGDMPMAVAVGANVVVTAHRGPVDFIDSVFDNEADNLRVGGLEAMSFAASLIDRMLTDYLDARDAFETSLDRLELLILRKPRPAYLGELQALRHAASRLRRQLASQRDLFDALGRPDFDPHQSEAAERHCQILSKRYSVVMGSIEAARELVNGSFDLYTSRAAESTNQAMQTLTVVTVAMGLAATIAGVLGMNFADAPLFHSGERGFAIATSAIGVLVIGAIIWALRRVASSSR